MVITGFVCYRAYKYLVDGGTQSCLFGILREVEEAKSENRLEFKGVKRELTKAEIEKLFVGRNVADCGNVLARSEDIHIMIGINNRNSDVKTRVWTNGDDGIQGTDDDLVVPYGETAP
ncbi:MAG: hypothetical protein M3209_02380 [Acidobacteriota bacterium]|nr:hypothetical protein [Acidobacteriota bacterium]